MTLLTLPRSVQVNSAGQPYAGARLNTYMAGTNTPLAMFTGPDLLTPHPNPLVADATGLFPAFFADPAGGDVRMVLTDSSGVLLYEVPIVPVVDARYLQTPDEQSAGVTPVNYGYLPGNPRRQGAPVDGLSSAVAALTAQNQTGEQMYLTKGTYLVDSDMTISSAVWREDGAIFKVADGVTLKFTGPFDGAKSQAFQLVGTGKVQFGSAANQTTYVPVAPLCPEYWGAQGVNGSGDDTAAVQACLSYLNTAGRPVVFLQNYPVSQVIATGNGLNIDFNNFHLIGNATTAKKAVLDLKCGYSTLRNVAADANFNPLYECAIHLYTNDLNSYYPGFNRIYGLWPRNALIGLCIGALPTQSLPCPAQGTVQAEGVATDAPVSETEIYGFQSYSCVRGVWMSQPNGKVHLSGTVQGSHFGWSSYGSSGYTDAFTMALCIKNDATQSSELYLNGGSLEQNTESGGTFIQITNGHLVCDGTTIEADCLSYLAGNSYVAFKGCLNMGWQLGSSYSPFLVDTNASGLLSFSDTFISYPNNALTSTTAAPFVKGASNLAGSYSTNVNGFNVVFTNVELRDVPLAPLTGTNRMGMTVMGVGSKFINTQFTSYGGSPPAIANQYDVSDGNDLLRGVVDTSNYTITAYGANGNATSGGWVFTVSGSSSWGSAASGITQLNRTVDKALKLFGAVGGSATATSPKFSIPPQTPKLFRGFILGGSTGATITITINWFNFAASAASTASTTLFSAADTVIGSTTVPFMYLCYPPKDATQAQIVVVAANGSATQITDYSLR